MHDPVVIVVHLAPSGVPLDRSAIVTSANAHPSVGDLALSVSCVPYSHFGVHRGAHGDSVEESSRRSPWLLHEACTRASHDRRRPERDIFSGSSVIAAPVGDAHHARGCRPSR